VNWSEQVNISINLRLLGLWDWYYKWRIQKTIARTRVHFS